MYFAKRCRIFWKESMKLRTAIDDNRHSCKHSLQTKAMAALGSRASRKPPIKESCINESEQRHL